MIIGTTGTQIGGSRFQMDSFILEITVGKYITMTEFHHGDCEGWDAWAHDAVVKHRPDVKIVGHPPINSRKRAYKNCDVLLPAKEYLDRNHDIVDAIDELVAAPKTDAEELRSGTWATIRYARKTYKPVYQLIR